MIVRSCNVFVQLIYRALKFFGHSKDYELWRLSEAAHATLVAGLRRSRRKLKRLPSSLED